MRRSFCAIVISFCLISLPFASHAQSVDQEKAKLESLRNQNSNLRQLNRELEANISRLNEVITSSRAENSDSNQALKAAEKILDEAKQAHQAAPSELTNGKLENANFKYAIALRKYQKSNPELQKQVQERQELQKAFDTNQLTINSNLDLIRSQMALVDSLEKEAAKRAEQQAQAAAEKVAQQPKVKSAAELKAEEDELKAALEEVNRLRALLSRQKEQQLQEQRKALEAENKLEKSLAEAEPKTTSETQQASAGLSIQFVSAIESQQAQSYWQSQAALGEMPDRRPFDKFVSIKTYENENLQSRDTGKLRFIGNNIFTTDNIDLDAKDTAFVIGQHTWRTTINQVLENQTIYYDGRNASEPKLIIVASE